VSLCAYQQHNSLNICQSEESFGQKRKRKVEQIFNDISTFSISFLVVEVAEQELLCYVCTSQPAVNLQGKKQTKLLIDS
jgi:hypothetical protein